MPPVPSESKIERIRGPVSGCRRRCRLANLPPRNVAAWGGKKDGRSSPIARTFLLPCGL